jgi:hypothetical protein
VVAKAAELRQQGKTHREVCDELTRLGFRTRTGKPWRHPQQIIKLLRTFGGDGGPDRDGLDRRRTGEVDKAAR